MKFNFIAPFAKITLVGFISLNAFAEQTALKSQNEWPKELSVDNADLKLYQPQFENSENDILKFRMAISVRQGDKSKEQIALMKGECKAVRQEAQNTVKCSQIKIDNVIFPTTVQDQDKLIAFLRQNIESRDANI